MSIPVKYCVLVQAADDEEAFRRVHPTMHANLKHGAFTLVGCGCFPPCREMSPEELNHLLKRFREPLDQKRKT